MSYGHDLAVVRSNRQEADDVAWHRSKAYGLLKQDVDDGKHLTMDPKTLWMTRVEYLNFGLNVFRKHIYQEVDSRPKRAARFERKKQGWKFPELHTDHPRLQQDDSD